MTMLTTRASSSDVRRAHRGLVALTCAALLLPGEGLLLAQEKPAQPAPTKPAPTQPTTAQPTPGQPSPAGPEGTGQFAASDLGQGWKLSPYVRVAPHSTFVLANIQGPGAIQSIWMTPTGNWRFSILRLYWDGETVPSVGSSESICT